MLLSSPCPSMQVLWAPARAAARAPWRVPGRGCGMGRRTRLASSSSSFRPTSDTGRRHRRSEEYAAGGACRWRRQEGAEASWRPETAAGGGRRGGREDTKTVSECRALPEARGRPGSGQRGLSRRGARAWTNRRRTQTKRAASCGPDIFAPRPQRSINLSPALPPRLPQTCQSAPSPPRHRPSLQLHWLRGGCFGLSRPVVGPKEPAPRTSSCGQPAQRNSSSASAGC